MTSFVVDDDNGDVKKKKYLNSSKLKPEKKKKLFDLIVKRHEYGRTIVILIRIVLKATSFILVRIQRI